MKILYVSFDEVPSFKGASTHILSGLRVPKKSHQITLLTLGSYSLPKQRNFVHIPVLIQERNYLKRAILFQNKVRAFLTENQFDLIHFRGPFEGVPVIESGVKCIYEVNAFPSIELNYHYSNLSDPVIGKIADWETFCLQHASEIICPSSRIKSLIEEISPSLNYNKISVLPNGYDPCTIEFKSISPKKRGVYIGTLSPWQGILWSLKAFRDLGDDFTLDIYSPYHKIYWKRALRRIQRYNLQDKVNIKYPLHKGELSERLSQYDFALAPLLKTERNTRQGCCPLKILDYLAHGVPTIASDLFVVRELIKDPAYPYFFHPGSVLSLKNTMKRLVSDPCERSYMKSLIINHPTWRDYGEKLSKLYGELT